MKKVRCLFLFLGIFVLAACSQTDHGMIEETPAESISDNLLVKVPELNDIAAYIDRQSSGQARMVIEAFEPFDDRDGLGKTVYVGEEWKDGHRINWYWFYVCEETGEVTVNNGSYGHQTKLDEWRDNSSDIRKINLIRSALADENCEGGDLDDWIGTYRYSGCDNQGEEVDCLISVNKIINHYYAAISIIGTGFHVRLDAGAEGNEDVINLIYRETVYDGFDRLNEVFMPGDVLFRLSKGSEYGQILIDWNSQPAMPGLSGEPDGICIRTDEYPHTGFIGRDVPAVNIIESNDPDMAEAVKAYNDFLNGRCYVRYDGYIRMIDHVMPLSGEKDRFYTLHDITGDGIPELVLAGSRLYILTCCDGELRLWDTDEHYGGSSYFVNDGNLYYRHGGIANTLMHAYEELDANGDCTRRYQVTLYVSQGAADTYSYTYIYSEDDKEHMISEEEYEKLVQEMSNDDQIKWIPFIIPQSTVWQ